MKYTCFTATFLTRREIVLNKAPLSLGGLRVIPSVGLTAALGTDSYPQPFLCNCNVEYKIIVFDPYHLTQLSLCGYLLLISKYDLFDFGWKTIWNRFERGQSHINGKLLQLAKVSARNRRKKQFYNRQYSNTKHNLRDEEEEEVDYFDIFLTLTRLSLEKHFNDEVFVLFIYWLLRPTRVSSKSCIETIRLIVQKPYG